MSLDDVLDDRQTQARAFAAQSARVFAAVEALERPPGIGLGHSRTVVRDFERDHTDRLFDANVHLTTCWRIAGGILQQVFHNLGEVLAIPSH